MAVTADGSYGGGSFTGVTLEVQSAYIKQVLEQDGSVSASLVYKVKVTLPDGTIQHGTSWDNVNTTPDLSEGHDTPMAQAEEHMKARLQASGWTNITDV